jgi:hypothetical protein
MAGIRMAKQAAVKDLEKFVERVTEAFDHKGMLVTDESTVKDLLMFGEGPHRVRKGNTGTWVNMPGDPGMKRLNDEKLARATDRLGIPVERGEYIVVVARRLKEFVQGGKS